MIPHNRNLSDKEIIETADFDLSTMGLGDREQEVLDGGSLNEGGIGVPANFEVIEQQVETDLNGEYIIHVTLEFDAVAGASAYRPYLRAV